jgi:hypothetical protein
MAGLPFLRVINGLITEVLGIQTSAGAGDAGKIPALDSTGRLDLTMMPVGVGAETVDVVASEAVAAGDLVNIYNAAGTPKIRKADASTTGKEAHGFVLAAVSLGGTAKVYLDGPNTQLTGLTAGRYWLSDTVPGGIVATAPTGAGKTSQLVGVANAATSLSFTAHQPIILAA